MAEKRSFNVGLNRKGLEAFVSEEQARHMVTTPGAHSVFIIEAHHGPYLTNEDGSITMSLIIDQVELIPDEQEDLVRRYQRALYLQRPDAYGQEAFDGATEGEPRVEDTARELESAVEKDEAGNVIGIWDGDPVEPTDSTVPQPEDTPTTEAAVKCPAPGCILPEEHDGDHIPDPTAETAPAPAFSDA